jgi:hypothetical protein
MRPLALATTAVLCLAKFFLACGKKDLDNPVIALTNLQNYDSLAPGVMAVKAVATDDKEVTHVQFRVDGVLAADDSAGTADTFQFSWDTSGDTLGAVHTIYAYAFDTRDSSTSAGATVIIVATTVPRSQIADAPFDGTFCFIRSLWPDTARGFLYGRNTNASAGTMLNDTLIARALFRFDISTRTSGDIRLHVFCEKVQGTPGPLDVYCVPDFDTIPTPTGWSDVRYWVTLKDSGELAATVTAVDSGWVAITIPEAAVARWRSATNGLALCLCAHDEATLPTNNYYDFDTYDSTPSGVLKPFLSW